MSTRRKRKKVRKGQVMLSFTNPSSSKVFQALSSSVKVKIRSANEKEISERTSHRLTGKDLQEDLATAELGFSDVCTNMVSVSDKTAGTVDSVIRLC